MDGIFLILINDDITACVDTEIGAKIYIEKLSKELIEELKQPGYRIMIETLNNCIEIVVENFKITGIQKSKYILQYKKIKQII